MRTLSIFVSLILTIFLSLISSEPAKALQVQLNDANANPGDNTVVDITVGDYTQEQIAAAAFTISYNTDILTLTQVESSFFDTFLNQWNNLVPVPDPLPPTSVIVNGQTYTQPLLFNTAEGKTLFVGARVKSGTPSTLFTLHFTVDASAHPGVYPVSISPIISNNVYAGYDETGESIPVLVGSIGGETDPTLAYPAYFPDIISGKIIVQTVFVDTDNDGIDDNWEMYYFGDLTTANEISDYDHDGYSDLQEYLNDIAGETDPEGNVYDPTIINAPGGTGYIPPSSGMSFWLLVLPTILHGSSLP